MQKTVPWGRIQAKDVKGSRDIPAFSAMANSQIKGVLAEMLGDIGAFSFHTANVSSMNSFLESQVSLGEAAEDAI